MPALVPVGVPVVDVGASVAPSLVPVAPVEAVPVVPDSPALPALQAVSTQNRSDERERLRMAQRYHEPARGCGAYGATTPGSFVLERHDLRHERSAGRPDRGRRGGRM